MDSAVWPAAVFVLFVAAWGVVALLFSWLRSFRRCSNCGRFAWVYGRERRCGRCLAELVEALRDERAREVKAQQSKGDEP